MQSIASDLRDIDLLFVVATSASMATIETDGSPASRWTAAAQAIRGFVAGIGGRRFGAGMLFYPLLLPGGDGGTLVEACSGSEYLALEVSIAPLGADGAQAALFDAALGSRRLEGGNAMAGALAGALRLAARAKATSGHIIQTVLVTDGAPDPCGTEVPSAAVAAGEAFRTDHLETYVLGIGQGASNLDPIAVAGGTFHAHAASSNDALTSTLVTMGR